MFLKVFRDDIIEGLQKSANIIPAKTGAAFLRTIWLRVENGALSIMSTDSNLEFCGTYSAEIIEEGLVGVQGRSFYDLIRKLPAGQITLKAEEEAPYLSIEQGNRKYKLPTNEKSWFQNFSAFPEEHTVFWAGDFLQELIDKTAYCISDEDTMEAIACLSLMPARDTKNIESCGLNGHQFAMQSFLHDDLHGLLPEGGVLIQKKYLVELKKWLSGDEIELSIDNKRLFFRTADKRETFSLPLSFYQYPDYNTFLSRIGDAGVSEMSVDRLELIDALERIMIFNTENNRCAYFQFGENGELQIYSQGQDIGTATEQLSVEYSGDLKKIAFPTRNLIEILNHFASEKVNFKLTGAEGPCGVLGDDDADYKVIIMPMKVIEETYYSEEGAE
ncbi:DNA polymerase III subunit beta [Desulfobaculum bizertense]|uniref:Beta sliding clamp n=1 Tax=Desulfobaculum bizertense DSM 18034 TaxID=1121442 RepID=A0A1T4X271_9BACT|nr:DNA polymerase III subunit beta [Desulfobaculum bizertense]UIJ37379.1 DNA polymerase III subunit beta [Desulfobaculum bizertense]SKA83579.1 DNA polymerase III, beta subunit [Desulfobaculum bizertense DSM 18034]